MKKLFLFLTLLSTSVSAEVYTYPITRVIDGDTVEFKADFLPKPLKPLLSIRVLGVDTPEKGFRAKCTIESDKGKSASDFTKELVHQSKVQQIEIKDWDKYGGRVLGDVILDGKFLSQELIKNGYARSYHGEKKESWCTITGK